MLLSFWVCATRHAQSTQNKKFAYLCNIYRKAMGGGVKLILRLQMDTLVFYKLIVSLWVCLARHAQITQNNKLAISVQYLNKELSDEVDFLHADKHENLLQTDSIVLLGMVKHSQSSQNSKFSMFLQYLEK